MWQYLPLSVMSLLLVLLFAPLRRPPVHWSIPYVISVKRKQRAQNRTAGHNPLPVLLQADIAANYSGHAC